MANLNLAVGTITFAGPEALRPALEAIAGLGIKEIDSAQVYGTNEADIGAAKVHDLNLIIHTKSKGGFNRGNALKPDVLYSDAHASVERLDVKQVDIFYIHAPDRTDVGKFENWVPTIDKLYKEGLFRRFGISNFSPQEVKDIYAYASANNFVLPSVYQGAYSAISRTSETNLFSILRERNIVFYAYSPIAGGFLARSKEQMLGGIDAGRYNKDDSSGIGGIFQALYLLDSFKEALGTWDTLATDEGITRAELAYRWVYYHSGLRPDLGDHVVIGASRIEQISSTVEGLKKGKLRPETVKTIDGIWDTIKHDSAIDENYDVLQEISKGGVKLSE